MRDPDLSDRLAKTKAVLSTSVIMQCDKSGDGNMTDIAVKDVSSEDERKAAFTIREAVFVDEQKVDLPLEFDGLDDEAEHLLATLEGKPAGTLRLRRLDGETSKIERVAVLKEARGRAIGAALLKAAIAKLRDDGARRAKLHAQTHALDFYAKLGFAARGDVFDEDGIPHRIMLLEL
jgi:ElaA protein